MNQLPSIIAEREEEVPPLCRQMPKYGRLPSAGRAATKKKDETLNHKRRRERQWRGPGFDDARVHCTRFAVRSIDRTSAWTNCTRLSMVTSFKSVWKLWIRILIRNTREDPISRGGISSPRPKRLAIHVCHWNSE